MIEKREEGSIIIHTDYGSYKSEPVCKAFCSFCRDLGRTARKFSSAHLKTQVD